MGSRVIKHQFFHSPPYESVVVQVHVVVAGLTSANFSQW